MTQPWYQSDAAAADTAIHQQALQRQDQLTKPPGSLGQLERLAVTLSGLQGRINPTVERLAITVFAGDHGVTAEGVSAFPQAVTAEMIRNFSRGGAAISVLARRLGAQFEVVNVGTVNPLETLDQVRDCRVMAGTANLAAQPAMTHEQLRAALQVGADAAERAVAQAAELFIAGEMGIGNTTPATALACALLGLTPSELAGPGTGLDAEGVARKVAVIEGALALHAGAQDSPAMLLASLGGLEIAAMAGAYIRCAQQRLPVLVDGFITTAAALCAVRINPSIRPWLLFGHRSAEPGHRLMLQALAAEPVLQLDMRLGEGSGAALAVSVLQAACALQSEMATFAEAAVSEAAPALED